MTPSNHPVAPPAPREGWLRDAGWIALAAAVSAALGSVLVVEFKFRVLDTLTWTSREYAWLAWAGNVMLFLLLLPAVGLATWVLHRRVGQALAALVFGFLACFALLLFVPGLHTYARGVLALGLAARMGVAIRHHPDRWMPRVRAMAGGGTLVLGLLGLAANGQQWVHEWRSLRTLPAPAAGAPNIILLILDTVRARNLSVYGYARPTTPTLERLAGEGVLFDHAYSTAPWTGPSHASMMTGLYAGQSEADYLRPMTDTAPTVAEALRHRGYANGAFMANAGFAGYQMGLARGFARFEDYPRTLEQALWSSTLTQTGSGLGAIEALGRGEWSRVGSALGRMDLHPVTVRRGRASTAGEIRRNFLAWRDGLAADRPYFAMLNFFDAHAPYQPPDGYAKLFNGGREDLDRYDGGIAYMDSVLSVLVEDLRERGDLDRTVLIVTSDHGELWGEHGLKGHGNALYTPLLRVPLLVRLPEGRAAGRQVSSLVSLRDLAATLVDLAGAPLLGIPGTSLAPYWDGDAATASSPVLAEASAAINPGPNNLTRFGPIEGSIDSLWHFIEYGDGRVELFAWRSDPGRLTDLSATETGVREVSRLQRQLERLLGGMGDGVSTGVGGAP